MAAAAERGWLGLLLGLQAVSGAGGLRDLPAAPCPPRGGCLRLGLLLLGASAASVLRGPSGRSPPRPAGGSGSQSWGQPVAGVAGVLWPREASVTVSGVAVTQCGNWGAKI